jgi:hypothetical protein
MNYTSMVEALGRVPRLFLLSAKAVDPACLLEDVVLGVRLGGLALALSFQH